MVRRVVAAVKRARRRLPRALLAAPRCDGRRAARARWRGPHLALASHRRPPVRDPPVLRAQPARPQVGRRAPPRGGAGLRRPRVHPRAQRVRVCVPVAPDVPLNPVAELGRGRPRRAAGHAAVGPRARAPDTSRRGASAGTFLSTTRSTSFRGSARRTEGRRALPAGSRPRALL